MDESLSLIIGFTLEVCFPSCVGPILAQASYCERIDFPKTLMCQKTFASIVWEPMH